MRSNNTNLIAIMKFFGRRKRPVSSIQVRDKTKLSYSVVCRGLSALTKEGLIVRTGSRGQYRYTLPQTRSGALVGG